MVSRVRQQSSSKWVTLTLACVTIAVMVFTVFFAYNSALEQPYSPLFISNRPERSILILNIASQVTIFFLAELTSLALDATRWALACSTSGVSALTFVALSRATNMIGTLYLLIGQSQTTAGAFQRHSHRLWGLQKYLN